MGKVEGHGSNWHGHVSAVTVDPEFRRCGVARHLMDLLEDISDRQHNSYFVDLFVRKSNKVAVDMYRNLGYIVYRQIMGYYSGKKDGEVTIAYLNFI